MARRDRQDDVDRIPKARRKLKRWQWLGLFFLVGIVLFVVFLPRIVTSRSVLVACIDQFAGLAPLQVEIDRVEAGWLVPVTASGIQLKDGDGAVLARVAKVITQKGLLGWITNSADLGTVQIQGLEAAVVARDGTTNLEEALAPLLAKNDASSTDDEADGGATTTGTIEIADAKFMLVEAGRPEQWVIQVAKLTATLPNATQVIGPIEIQASIGEASGVVLDSVGSLIAKVQHAQEAFTIQAQLQHVPVDFWHVIHARLPDIPIDELRGRVSATLIGNLVDAEKWSFDVQNLESRDLAIFAPEILGAEPALLALVSGSGRASLANSMMTVQDAKVACDFGAVNALANIPWPMNTPTAMNPFLDGATINAEGSVDLPKLAEAAKSLLPVREGTELLSGTAQFLISQTLNPQGVPSSRANLSFANLKANAAGQELIWDEPLSIELAANQGAAGLQFGASALAEFCNFQGGGTLESGQFLGNVNLEQLHERLSQWIELPIRSMNGTASLDLVWSMPSGDLLQTNGKLNTTPLQIVTSTGGQIQEPAWAGIFSATTRLADGVPTHVDLAKLELTALDEKLTVDLQEPLSLVARAEGVPVAPPAAFEFTLVGDLAGWKRRGTVWLSEPPNMEIGGNINLAVGGRIDLNHVEISQANWGSKPIQISTPSLSIAEREMLGNFKGRIDTSDLTRLQVEALQVRATSFSIGAKDAASADGKGRTGQAMFLVDLNQLLNNIDTSSGKVVVDPTQPTTAEMSATGRVQGQLLWEVTSEQAGLELKATGENIVVTSKSPGTIAPQPLWDEPTITSTLSGKWVVASGAVDISKLQVETPWCNYVGNLTYQTQDKLQQIITKGQAVVDTAKLSTKIGPMTGNQVQLFGQETIPIEAQWVSSNDPNTSMLAGLQAVTRIGWQQARVAGIDVGQADVPVTVSHGQLATKAEIPVSGGMLRWDVTSDLTAEEMVIHQSPMTVLENVEITDEMCKGWLKYVTPLIAEATSVDGRLSLVLNQAKLVPANPRKQTVVGQLIMHSAEVGPGPLSNQIIGMVKQIDALRKKDFTQAASSQQVWMKMPEQRVDFQMVDGQVSHRNLNVRVGDVTLSTAGSVDVSGQMNMLASMPIPDDWVEKSPLLAGLRGQSLQFPIHGTLKQPQINSESIRQLGRQTVQNAAQGLLEKGLSRGFEKIFGGPAPATPPKP
jgi:translocation and assembly module TamB